jgi:hypothetical protein
MCQGFSGLFLHTKLPPPRHHRATTVPPPGDDSVLAWRIRERKTGIFWRDNYEMKHAIGKT